MSDKLKCLVLRHGDSELNNLGILRGWADVPLTQLGKDQALEASKFLKDFKIANVFCSPLLRAWQTASIVSEQNKYYPIQTRGLFPLNLGIFTRVSKEAAKDALGLFIDNSKISIPYGESLDDFDDRQFQFWNSVFTDFASVNLYVCHNSTIITLAKFVTGEDKDLASDEIISTGGIIGIYGEKGKYSIRTLFEQQNSTSPGIGS